MQSYSATITCSIVVCLAPHGLLTSKCYKFYKNTYKMLFCETSNLFLSDLLFIGCDIAPQVMIICLHFIKHVSLSLKIYK